MKILLRSFIILLQLVAFKNIKAQYIEFVENKGQWDERVKFEGRMQAGTVFLRQTGYTVLLNNDDDVKRIFDPHPHNTTTKTRAEDHGPEAGQGASSTPGTGILHSHAYEVNFLNASPKAFIEPDKAVNTFNNYFLGNDPAKWRTHCSIYQGITYKNVYPNIDVRYYTDNNSLKYDIIVNPGGDINSIAMQFNGTDGLSLKNGNLIIKTSVGDVTELSPLSYQYNGTTKTKVDAKFVIIGNTVRFKVGSYSKSGTLVIDPALVFSTFSGSKSDNWGYTATYDGGGNFYSGGITFADGFPASLGAYQTQYRGGDNSEGSQSPDDIVIIKYSPNGSQRIYGTYIGGSGNESPHSLVVDNNGDLIISGRTSSSDFPSTQPVYGPGGGADIFILKLNPDGTNLIGSRRFGGSGNDGVNIRSKYATPSGIQNSPIRRNYGDDARSEVIIDNANNIYLASCTQSSNFLVTANAFQKNSGGGQDGVLIKTNFDLSNVLISSYLGGSKEDAAFVLALSPENNNILVGGGTASTNFPGTSNGPAIAQTYGGGECDGFISLISNNGSTLIKSSYIGTTGNDLVYGVQYDKFGFPYIMGTTTGKWPVVNAAFSQANGKQFIGKMKKDISAWEYSTVFGKGSSTPDISPTAFLVDRCENVYVSGWGGTADEGYPNSGTSGLTTTANGLYKTTDGSDFYFFVLERNAASQLYGSFFGNQGGYGDHVDGGTSRFNREGVIYQTVCANCGKQGTFRTTPGVWSPSNAAVTGAQCNMASVKIAFELAGVGSGVRASIEGVLRDTSGCVPLTVDFTDTIATAKKYIWNFGDGSPDQTTTTPSISHTYTQIGDYKVRLIAIDSTTCNIADTSYTSIRARNDRAILSMKFNKIVPPCEALKYQFTNTSVAPPNKPFKPGAFVWDFGDGTTSTEDNPQHSYAAAGTYIVKLSLNDTIYCNAPDVIDTTLRVAPNVVARVETPPFGCAPYDAVFNNVSLAGQTFNWDFGDGTTSTLTSPVHTYTAPGTYTVRLEAIDPSTCNGRDDTTFTVIVSPKPTAIFTYSPLTPEENKATTFTNSSLGATSYKWDFGDGEELTTTRIDTLVQHYYNRTGTYKVCLVAYNNYGCTDTTCQEVQALVVPLIDVPNAFTPNGDGVNDQVNVKGYGIQKLAWRIYNRWGTLVYMSTNQKNGWDGKYKGVLQPQDVYTYILDAEFTDGTSYQKKGDITLLR